MENILEVTGLNKNYPNFSLKDVSFALPDGCITGFIGKHGAGKTTTLKSILDLVPRTSGSIKWFGMDLYTNAKEIKSVRKRMSSIKKNTPTDTTAVAVPIIKISFL